MINNNNILPYFRKDTSNLLVFSTAIVLLMFTGPLVLSHFLLQPVQAQTAMNFRTTEPATNKNPNTGQEYTLTFDARGTTSSSNPQSGSITNGTFQISSNGKILASGYIISGEYSNSSRGATFVLGGRVTTDKGTINYALDTACSTSRDNDIDIYVNGESGTSYKGPVECSTLGGGDTTMHTTTQQSSSMAGSSQEQDGDGDGIPDSSDKCTHNSNPRCFKEAA